MADLAADSIMSATGLVPGIFRRCVELAILRGHRPFVGSRLIGWSSEMTDRAVDKRSQRPCRVFVEKYGLVESIQMPGRFANAHQSLPRDIVELLEQLRLATWRDL